jgi:hypothetical protein
MRKLSRFNDQKMTHIVRSLKPEALALSENQFLKLFVYNNQISETTAKNMIFLFKIQLLIYIIIL